MIFQTILEGIRLDALPVLVCAVGMAVIAAALAESWRYLSAEGGAYET